MGVVAVPGVYLMIYFQSVIMPMLITDKNSDVNLKITVASVFQTVPGGDLSRLPVQIIFLLHQCRQFNPP